MTPEIAIRDDPEDEQIFDGTKSFFSLRNENKAPEKFFQLHRSGRWMQIVKSKHKWHGRRTAMVEEKYSKIPHKGTD